MSLEEVAVNVGCNRSQVSRWEQEKLNPSEDRIVKLVDLFGRWDFVVLGEEQDGSRVREMIARFEQGIAAREGAGQ